MPSGTLCLARLTPQAAGLCGPHLPGTLSSWVVPAGTGQWPRLVLEGWPPLSLFPLAWAWCRCLPPAFPSCLPGAEDSREASVWVLGLGQSVCSSRTPPPARSRARSLRLINLLPGCSSSLSFIHGQAAFSALPGHEHQYFILPSPPAPAPSPLLSTGSRTQRAGHAGQPGSHSPGCLPGPLTCPPLHCWQTRPQTRHLSE